MQPLTHANFEDDLQRTLGHLLKGGQFASVDAVELRIALELLVTSVSMKTQQQTRNQLLMELMTVDQVAERLGMSREEVLTRIEQAYQVRGIGRQVESGGWLILEEELDLL